MPSSVPFRLRPSAQPFIPCRSRPSQLSALSAQVACGAPVQNLTEICTDATQTENFAHLPSVGTWIQKSPRECGQGAAKPQSAEAAQEYCLVKPGVDLPNQLKEQSDARLMNLIQSASHRSVPSFIRGSSTTAASPFPKAFMRFQPSVGTWLQPRHPAIPPASLKALTLPEPHAEPSGNKDEATEVAVVLVESRSAPSPVPEEDGIGLHFFHLDFEKVDQGDFEEQLLESLINIGCSKELLANLNIKLRPGSAGSIAEIRGTAKSVQELKSMPVYAMKIMGCEAKSAANAAALAAAAAGAPSGSYPPSLSSSSERQPLLGRHPSRLTSEGRTPLLSGTPMPELWQLGMPSGAMMPTERHKAGPKRLQARDLWNVEELRLSDIMTRSLDLQEGAENIDPGLEEKDLTEILSELYGEEPDSEAVHWTFYLASRGNGRCTSASDLHYACRAHHYCHFLHQDVMRTLATTVVSSRGVNSTLLQKLLEDLNGGFPVPAAEVQTVLDEADGLASTGGSGRASLLRAISAWYLNVVRSDSPWTTTLKACYSRWIPKKGYHLEVLSRLRASLVKANEAFHEEHSPDSTGQAVWLLIQAAGLFAALVFPSCFCLWLVVVGVEHGDDRCPKDLDGLITWFGSLGLATMVVGWADGFAQSKNQMASSIGLGLKAVLLILPWVGAFSAFNLARKDQQVCGLFLTEASSILWTTLLFAEVVVGFVFLWRLSIFNEHEMTLRKGFGLHHLA